MIERLYETPEIYRILVPLPENPLKLLNSYVIKSEGEVLMIDTGFNRPECKEALKEGIAELGIDVSKMKLFITHLHSDHSGNADYLYDLGADIYMGKIDYDILIEHFEKDTWSTMFAFFKKNGFPDEMVKKQYTDNQAVNLAPAKPFPVTTVSDGDVLRIGNLEFEVVFTPGHTPGQMCLYLRKEKLLFSADHILFDITPNNSFWFQAKSSLQDYLDSLDKVEKLEIVKTFPGHREFEGDVYERISTLRRHHYERLQEILDAIVIHPGSSTYEIASYVSWSARGRKFKDFGANQQFFAVGETLSHLAWLEQNDCVVKDEDLKYTAVKEKIFN